MTQPDSGSMHELAAEQENYYTKTETTPATSSIEVARQQAESLIKGVASSVNLELQYRIDELCNLQANIARAQSALMHYVGEYADRCNEAIATSKTIKKEIEDMASPFSKSPPATITQLGEEGK